MPRCATDACLLYEADRFNVMAVDRPVRGGGSVRRQFVSPADAVVVLPMLDEHTVVLIRNDRFAVRAALWELPAGMMEPGEQADSCAARELTEETGYVAAKITRLIEFYPAPGICTELMTAFRAEELTFRGQDLDPAERIEVECVSLERAVEMVRNNRIRDAKTIATLLYHRTFCMGAV